MNIGGNLGSKQYNISPTLSKILLCCTFYFIQHYPFSMSNRLQINGLSNSLNISTQYSTFFTGSSLKYSCLCIGFDELRLPSSSVMISNFTSGVCESNVCVDPLPTFSQYQLTIHLPIVATQTIFKLKNTKY